MADDTEFEDQDRIPGDDFPGGEEYPEAALDDAYMSPDSEEEQEDNDDNQQEAAPEPEPVKYKKPNIGERLSQVQRERYQALDEVRALREENERLRAVSEASTKTALQHYDQAVMQKLHNAKEQKIKALESGDIHAQAEADMALSLASSEYYQLTNLQAQQKINDEAYAQQPQQSQQPSLQEDPIVRQWAAENSWFNPSSDDYDDLLSVEVDKYCQEWDREIYKAGQQRFIGSPFYLSKVSEYAQQLQENPEYIKYANSVRGEPAPARRELNMKPARGTVSPVRGGGTRSSPVSSAPRQQQERIGLSTEEKDLIRRLGVDEKVYVQQKANDKRTGRDRRR